jgi:hypothetical protein
MSYMIKFCENLRLFSGFIHPDSGSAFFLVGWIRIRIGIRIRIQDGKNDPQN